METQQEDRIDMCVASNKVHHFVDHPKSGNSRNVRTGIPRSAVRAGLRNLLAFLCVLLHCTIQR